MRNDKRDNKRDNKKNDYTFFFFLCNLPILYLFYY